MKRQTRDADSTPKVGGAFGKVSSMKGYIDLEAVEREAHREWDASLTLRAEFGERKADYLAWKRADAQGKMRVLGGQPARVQELRRA
jgi:hypothetical protein